VPSSSLMVYPSSRLRLANFRLCSSVSALPSLLFRLCSSVSLHASLSDRPFFRLSSCVSFRPSLLPSLLPSLHPSRPNLPSVSLTPSPPRRGHAHDASTSRRIVTADLNCVHRSPVPLPVSSWSTISRPSIRSALIPRHESTCARFVFSPSTPHRAHGSGLPGLRPSRHCCTSHRSCGYICAHRRSQ
jgi:hypothetical protein